MLLCCNKINALYGRIADVVLFDIKYNKTFTLLQHLFYFIAHKTTP